MKHKIYSPAAIEPPVVAATLPPAIAVVVVEVDVLTIAAVVDVATPPPI